MEKILSCLKPYRGTVILAVSFMVLDVLCEVIQPTLMADIIGRGIQSANVGYILKIGLMMLLVAAIGLLSGFANARYSAWAGAGFAANLRTKLFEKVQTFSFQNIDTFSTASLNIRLTNDVTQMQNMATMGMRLMIRAPLMLPFALVMAIRINARLAMVLGVALPILLILLIGLVLRAVPLFGKMQNAIDRLNRTVQENVTNMRVVKSFVREDYEAQKFNKASGDQMNAALRAMNAVVINMPLMMLVMNGTIVAVVLFGGQQIIADTLTVAQITKFINYIIQIMISLMMLAMVFVMLTRASASYQRIRQVLETESKMKYPEHALEAKNLRGDVEFRNVSFRYDTKDSGDPVLSNINFSVKAKEMVAIVGGTGAGKSSLVQLIPRLYDVTEGQVLVDDTDVRKFHLSTLHHSVAMVLQKNTLFSGTIRDNLRWGDEHATDDAVMAAAQAAQAHEFIQSFPNGYDTWIEQGGVNLSGGQKQRLCIARALLKKPAILILDDSTSAVDTATEQRIREALRKELSNTTIFLIAQRISSVRDADKIIVMDNGTVAGIGKHEKLLASCEAYQEIYASQQGEEAGA